jgi:hypothetical protein
MGRKPMSDSQRRQMSKIMIKRWADAKRAKRGIGVDEYLAAHSLCDNLLSIVDCETAVTILNGIKDNKDA